MDKNRIFKIYDKVYSLTSSITPQKFDCGLLCNSACCKNSSFINDESGMHLLPFEREYLISKFSHLPYKFISSGNEELLICNGNCKRYLRPISCRIFPYFANILNNGKIKISPDIRAVHLCPLIFSDSYKRKNVYFSRNIKRACRILLSEPVLKEDILKTSEFINSIYELNKRIFDVK